MLNNNAAAKRSGTDEKLSFHIQLHTSIYSRLLRLKKSKGVNNKSELIRLAIADYLERAGF